MSKGDILTVSCTAIAISAGFLLSGPIAGCLFLVVGIVFLAFYFQREDDKSSTTILGDISPDETIRAYVEDFQFGVQMYWGTRTWLFVKCRLVSSSKSTSITKIVPTVFADTGESWKGELIEDLSEWIFAPEKGSDIDLESMSLWCDLKHSELEKEIQKSGWIGIVLDTPLGKKQDSVNRVDFSIEDGAGQVHLLSLPVKQNHSDAQIVAKHLRHVSH